jgi:hypothetical protein
LKEKRAIRNILSASSNSSLAKVENEKFETIEASIVSANKASSASIFEVGPDHLVSSPAAKHSNQQLTNFASSTSASEVGKILF